MNPTSHYQTRDEVFQSLPPLTADNNLRKEIRQQWLQSGRKIIVLDDDPTGVQTVHDIYVITDWSKDWLRQGLMDDRIVLYILTNTRSYPPQMAEMINREIMQNLTEVSQELAIDFIVISRGDSTLRGHYPLEINVPAEELYISNKMHFDGHLIIPAFFEAGRYTLGDTHYLQEGDHLVPVHETEFAKDAVFGFSDAHLPQWVVEKGGAQQIDEVQSITIEDIRIGGVERVLQKMLAIENNSPVIVNAASYGDLDIVSLALVRAIEQGKRYLFRTAASFVKSFAGIGDRPFLTSKEMIAPEAEGHGGLIIVGSHTRKTTEQLNELIHEFSTETIEIGADQLLNPAMREKEIEKVKECVEERISHGLDVVLFTSRKVITAQSKEANLTISQTISNSLAEIVNTLRVKPQFIIAKGGITSSDIATQGLQVKKAKILGQAAAGVPVWLTGDEARIPQIPYIVFPGNVGDRYTLAEIVRSIKSINKEHEEE